MKKTETSAEKLSAEFLATTAANYLKAIKATVDVETKEGAEFSEKLIKAIELIEPKKEEPADAASK